MIMILKQKKIKFKPRINLNHNIYVWFILPLLAASGSYNLLFTSEIVSNGGKIEKF